MTRPQYVTPTERIASLVREHGSYQKAADATGASRVSMIQVATGIVKQPRAAFVRAIGLDPDTGAFCPLRS